jgi:hypothetical protein
MQKWGVNNDFWVLLIIGSSWKLVRILETRYISHKSIFKFGQLGGCSRTPSSRISGEILKIFKIHMKSIFYLEKKKMNNSHY